jgi:hypothetical protein
MSYDPDYFINYRKTNSEKLREQKKRYYLDNKEEFKTRSSEYYKKNKDKIKVKIKKYREKNVHKRWAMGSLYNHKCMGFKISIDIDFLYELALKSTYCPYCRRELDWNFGVGLKSITPSLDRINNDNELRTGNVEIICNECNRTKGNRTKEGFIRYCKNVGDFYENNL